MTKEEYAEIIRGQINIEAGYLSSFETTILILSEILEERDRIYDEYKNAGSKPVIEFTTDRKSVNPKINPLLDTWNKLNTTALAYLDKLGLTAAGLRKLQGQLPKSKSGPDPFQLMQQAIDNEPSDLMPAEYWRQVRKEVEEKSQEAANL